jgi:hypothetical protein
VAQVADKMAPCSGRPRSLAFAPTNRHLLEAFDVIVSGPDFRIGPSSDRHLTGAESRDHDPKYTALLGIQTYPVPLGVPSFEDRVVNRAHEALLSYSYLTDASDKSVGSNPRAFIQEALS